MMPATTTMQHAPPSAAASRPAARGVILLYHRVNRAMTDPFGLCVSPRRFREQMTVLRDRACACRLDALHAAADEDRIRPGTVAVTFDDGYADNYLNALPILQQVKVPATVFVTSGLLNSTRELWHDELDRILLQPGTLPARMDMRMNGSSREWPLESSRRLGYLKWWRERRWRNWHQVSPTARHAMYRECWCMLHDAAPAEIDDALRQLREQAGLGACGRRSRRWLTHDELRALASSPLIEIGGHTVRHPSLGMIERREQQREIEDNKAALESLIDREISSFAYPFGTRDDFSAETIVILRDAGYCRACSNYGGAVSSNVHAFDLPRVVVQDWSGEEFARRLDVWLQNK